MNDETDDCAFLGAQLVLRQFRRGHRAGTDACLLAAALDVRPGDRVVDAGAGVGAAALALLRRAPEAEAVLIERDESVRALSDHNIAVNGLRNQARSVAADLFDRAGLSGTGLFGSADVVISNPPFYQEGTMRTSTEQRRRDAYVLRGGSLAEWVRTLVRIAKPGGKLVLVHRPECLPDLLGDWLPGSGAIRFRAIHAHVDRPATRMLLVATVGSRAPFVVLPPLTLHGDGGAFTPEAEAIHRGRSPSLM